MVSYEEVVAFWQKKNIGNDAELLAAVNGHSVLFAYHCGKIENENVTYNDTRDIFEHDGVSSYTGDLRTLFEIKNAKSASKYILDSFEKKRPLDEKFVLQLQKILTQGTYDERRWKIGERPGQYKHHDFVTGRKEVGAHPDDVREEMEELLGEVMFIPQNKALVAAAYFHAKFENIHPFADGNGRCGRFAMNYLLLKNNHPPLIIHEEDRKEYYAALETWDEKQDLTPLYSFFRAQTQKTWEKQVIKHKKRENSIER